MDYIDYELEKYYKRVELADSMEKLGFENEDEYYDYLAELQAEAQIAYWDAIEC